MGQFEAVTFTKELMVILKNIPKRDWDVISVQEIIKKVRDKLNPPGVLEINVGENQQVKERIG